MKTLLVLLRAFATGNLYAETVSAKVNGMVCAFCAQGIEKKLRAQKATQDVFVSLENKVVAVALKSGQTLSDDTMKQVITDAGYAVTGITRSEEPLDAVRAAAKKKP